MTTPADTTTTQELPAADLSPVVDDTPPPPFVSALTFDLTKRINLTQLTDEIDAAVGSTVHLAVSGGPDFNPDIDPSASNVGTLNVSPASVDRAKVQAALDAHHPSDVYAVPQAEQDFAAVQSKVMTDPTATLTADEVAAAVKGLLARASTPQPTSSGGGRRGTPNLLG